VDAVPVDPGATYPISGVYSFGKGLLSRPPLPGSQTTYKVFHRLHSDDIVMSQLKAWEGAIARVTPEFDGWFLSPQFVTFKPTKVDSRYVEWFCKQSSVWTELMSKSRGMGARRDAVSPSRFLSITIPLPPPEEQQRIVARIEYLCQKTELLNTLHSGAIAEVERLLASEEMRVWPGDALVGAKSLEDVTVFLARGRQSEQGPSEHYLIKTQHVQDRKFIPSRMTLAHHIAAKVAPESLAQPRDVLIACSAAGCLGRVAYFDQADTIASTDTHVAIARANRDVILPEYLYAYLRSAQGQYQLKSREKGDWQREKVGFRFTELNVADMRLVPVPLPGLKEQRRIVDHVERFTQRIDALRNFQSQRALEIAALRPSVLNHAFSGQL